LQELLCCEAYILIHVDEQRVDNGFDLSKDIDADECFFCGFTYTQDLFLDFLISRCVVGYQLIISKDGKEAFELIDKHQDEIDLLCVDYHLPRFNGIEITEKLRSVRAKCRAILMSGSPIQYEDEEIGGVHFSHILTKPVELSEFARVIRKTLDSPSTKRVE
jgi:CheY-like chemotaxis protein